MACCQLLIYSIQELCTSYLLVYGEHKILLLRLFVCTCVSVWMSYWCLFSISAKEEEEEDKQELERTSQKKGSKGGGTRLIV